MGKIVQKNSKSCPSNRNRFLKEDKIRLSINTNKNIVIIAKIIMV